MRILRIVALGAALNIIAARPVFADCYQPSSPPCATRYGAFDDQDDFEQCKRKMTNYKSEVESFLSCRQDDAEQARSQYNSAVESFNRRARA
jgi:hypothetical protein